MRILRNLPWYRKCCSFKIFEKTFAMGIRIVMKSKQWVSLKNTNPCTRSTKARFFFLREAPVKYTTQWDFPSSHHSFNDSMITHRAHAVKSSVLSGGNRSCKSYGSCPQRSHSLVEHASYVLYSVVMAILLFVHIWIAYKANL